jgi:tetratricopeptide (TPR) repeat protein
MNPGIRDGQPMPVLKKRLFHILLFLIPVLALCSLEACLRVFHYGGDTSLFVSTPDEASPYYGINRDVGKRYFALTSFTPSPRKDLFLKNKPAGGFRVFVLGESTVAGFPYGNNVTFPRILNRRLFDLFPERRIEVVNTGMTAISSYAILDFMDEILSQKPDALLIYAGHNEFYGALGAASVETLGRNGWVVRSYLKLRRLKIFILMRNIVGLVQKAVSRKTQSTGYTDPMETEMSRIADNRPIPLHGKMYKAGKRQFKDNLRRLLSRAREAGIPVYISDLVSNLRDQAPFISQASDTLPAAADVFRKAGDLEREGSFEAARKAYLRAKDLDCLHFRAAEEFNAIIREAADEFGAAFVPMKSVFESASPKGLIGNSLMHEHLHPNIDGYFLMADAFFNAMRDGHLIAADWQGRSPKPSSYYRTHWGFTAFDSVHAALNILHLKGGWPFREAGPNTALDRFRPVSKEDSVAAGILRTGGYTLEQGHIALGEAFRKAGQAEKAFREYEALVYTVPHLDLFYEPALKILMDDGRYDRALRFLEEGSRFNESAFIWKWIGQLRLALGDTEGGISACEKARRFSPLDAQLLYNLARAYYHTSRIREGDALANQLRNMRQDRGMLAELESVRNRVQGAP